MLGEDEEMPVLEILEGGAETDSKKTLPLLSVKKIRASDSCCHSLCLCSINCGCLSMEMIKTRVVVIPLYRH